MKKLEIIAFSIDLARQKERVDFIKRQMDFCLKNGYNTVLLYLEASVRTFVTSFFDEASSYSLEELSDMVNYGEDIGLNVVPAFETLSHTEKFFVYDELAPLSEFSDENAEGRGFCSSLYPRGSHGCVTNPDFQTFIDTYVTEVCSVFRSKYVHMGMDEIFEFACCKRCKKHIDDGDIKQELFLKFVLHARDLVKSMGKVMMIWDDMLEYFPVAELLPRDIIFCNWNYVFIGAYPKGKWTGRCHVDPFVLYDKLGFKYLFCCKAGNLSQTFNVDSYTEYAKKHNPVGAVLTSWERSDCFYPCLMPVTAYAGRLWSGRINETSAPEVFAEYIKSAELSERLIDLFAPDFLFCHADIMRVAEENNHVLSAFVAQVKAVLKAFGDYKSKNPRTTDVFDDLYANIALTYARLSLSATGNKIFDEYERGGIKNVEAYLPYLKQIEKLFILAEKTGNRLWQKYREGITSYQNAWQNSCKNNRELVSALIKDLKSSVLKPRGVLRLKLMLPDTYSSIRAEIFIRYRGEKNDVLLYKGSTKTSLTMFDVSGEYLLRFATEPKTVESIVFCGLGEGAQYLVYAEYFDGKTWSEPKSVNYVSGIVKDEENLLKKDTRFATLGTDDGLAHMNDIFLSKTPNAVKIIF